MEPEFKEQLHKQGWGLRWEDVVAEKRHSDGQDREVVSLQRTKVPGGWIVRSMESHRFLAKPGTGNESATHQWVFGMALAFVPDSK